MYNKIVYEWDDDKRRRNLEKHGLDFADAYLVFENQRKITLETPRSSEKRRMDIALVELHGTVLVLVYAIRSGNVRAISFRRASVPERKAYAAIEGEE